MMMSMQHLLEFMLGNIHTAGTKFNENKNKLLYHEVYTTVSTVNILYFNFRRRDAQKRIIKKYGLPDLHPNYYITAMDQFYIHLKRKYPNSKVA